MAPQTKPDLELDMPISEYAMEERLLNDINIANALGLSRGWVRKERFNRNHHLPHTLTIDPVMIGSFPRYRLSEFEEWLSSLKSIPPCEKGVHNA